MRRGTTEHADCANCPFSVNGIPNRAVTAIGPDNPKWIVVGEGPGGQEVIFGVPFVGPSGQLVNKALAAIGQSRDNIWITNATLCKPPAFATEDDKNAARKACGKRLQVELKDHSNKPILALGGLAAKAILGHVKSINQIAGSHHSIDSKRFGKRSVIATIHPAAILRGGGSVLGAHAPDLAFWNLIYDAAKIEKIASGADIIFKEDDVQMEWEDANRAEDLILGICHDIRRLQLFAVDTETYVINRKKHSAKQPLNALMSAIGLATVERAVSVAWPLMTRTAMQALQEIFSDTSIKKVMHNSLYDVPVLKRHGLSAVEPIEDTMLAHHACFPGLAHGLQRVATQFFAISPWKAEFRAGTDSPENLTRYNAKDTLTTARLHAPLEICVKKTQAERVYQIDLAAARAARIMHEKGVPVSRQVNQELYDTFQTNMQEAWGRIRDSVYDKEIREDLWHRLAHEQAKRMRKNDPEDYDERAELRFKRLKSIYEAGKWEWKIGSGEHVAAYLRARGVPLYTLTDKGFISTKKEILEEYAHKPEVRAILDYRENQKSFSTFVYRMFDRYNSKGELVKYGYADENDRIHPHWAVHKITGRWGATDPMAQNWPKHNPKTGRPNLRAQVVAREDLGRVFVGFDFAQLEARIHALLSGDEFLLNIFKDDKDIHIEFARVVWPIFDTLPEKQREKLRNDIKRPEYGALYGAMPTTLHKNLIKDYPKMKLSDVTKMLDIMNSKMIGVQRWHNDLVRNTAQPPHELRSFLYGRRRCFPLGNASLNDVYNFPVQSTGADIMATGLARITDKLHKYKEAYPILQIHDAMVFECYEDEAEELKKDVYDCFTQEYTHNGNTVLFPIDPKIGRSWAKVD